MKGTRLFSIVGGIILIAAAFLPYGYSIWASGSTFDVTMNVLNRVNDENSMLNLLEQVGLSNTMSAIMLGFVVVAFFLDIMVFFELERLEGIGPPLAFIALALLLAVEAWLYLRVWPRRRSGPVEEDEEGFI